MGPKKALRASDSSRASDSYNIKPSISKHRFITLPKSKTGITRSKKSMTKIVSLAKISSVKLRTKCKDKIEVSDASKLLYLLAELTDNSCAVLQTKINNYLTQECGADTTFQLIVRTDRMEAYIEAVGHSTLRRKIKITYLPKDNVRRRVVLFPMHAKPFSVIFCVVAPTEDDVPIIIFECSRVSWPTLKKAIAFEHECNIRKKCQQLLRVARMLFSQAESLQTVLRVAMDQTKQLTQAEYCAVKLIDHDKKMLYDPFSSEQDWGNVHLFPLHTGITGEVIKTKTVINCRMTQNHPLFDASIDCLPGVECRNLLFFPIRDNKDVTGVAQLINKVGEPYFDATDEELAQACSIYCGVTIIHSLVYNKVEEAQARNALVNEQIMYHIQVSEEEVKAMLNCTGLHNYPHITNIHFTYRALPLKELPCCMLKMFVDLGFDKMYKIKHAKLCRFILYVKKEYRDVAYHNWLHAFRVAHFAYAAIINFKLVALGYYTNLQALMYMIAALTHDLDHRGTTNSFQIQGSTTLAALYSSEGSVMERHHFAQAMSILNTTGCDILEALPRKEYEKAINILRDYIIATDLANYFKNLEEYKRIASNFNKDNKIHINALHCIMINAADLSDQVKDWQSLKITSLAVLTEFFTQGEMEKNLGETPNCMMDREKCFIPDLEIQFLQEVCYPLFEMVGQIFPIKAAAFTTIIERHIERWEASKPVFAAVPLADGLSVLLSPQLDHLISINLREKSREQSGSIKAKSNT